MSILLGGVGDHPGERKKRPSTLHFRYEHPRTAPLGSVGAGALSRLLQPYYMYTEPVVELFDF